jgi:hypothetical protein
MSSKERKAEEKKKKKEEKERLKEEKKRKKQEKNGPRPMVIEGPTNVTHVSHIGWDNANGFQVDTNYTNER